MTAASALRLGFLIFDGFPMACLTSAIEPLRAANEITGTRAFDWRVVAERAAPVRSSAEVRFEPDVTLADVGGLDHLFLIAPPTARFANPRQGHARLRLLDRMGMTIGAFSGGIFPLARAGLMAGRAASVHWCYDSAFRAEFPDVTPLETVILRDGRRITASGAGAVFDLMLRLIEDRLGRQCMTEVACWFQHPFVRDEDAAQKVPVARTAATEDRLSAPIRAAIRLLEQHIETPLRIPQVAGEVGLSGRHFERLFKAETGQSPLRFYRHLRLAKARQRVVYSGDDLHDIARGAGFAALAQMAPHYRAAFGIDAREERRLARGLATAQAAE